MAQTLEVRSFTLNGFASKWLIYQSLFSLACDAPALAGRAVALAAIGVLALVGGLAVACFTRAVGIAFLGRARALDGDGDRAEQALRTFLEEVDDEEGVDARLRAYGELSILREDGHRLVLRQIASERRRLPGFLFRKLTQPAAGAVGDVQVRLLQSTFSRAFPTKIDALAVLRPVNAVRLVADQIGAAHDIVNGQFKLLRL